MTLLSRSALVVALALTAVRAEAYHPQWTETLMQRMGGARLFHLADFNSDDRPDLLLHSSVRLHLATLKADGTFNPYTLIYSGSYVSDTTTADATGDGKADVIVADTATNTITVVPSNGDGTFGTPTVTALTVAPSQLARGDYNGDGKLDLAVRSYSAALLLVYAGDGAGHFTELSRTATASSIYRITGGDIDGDGKMDVVLSNNGSWQHEFYFGRGNGTFDGPIAVAAPAVVPMQLQLADLDADGDQELVTCEFNPNTVTVFRNNGSRSFASYDTYTLVATSYGNPTGFAIGDFTDDGDTDIAVTLVNAGAIATLEGNGNGTFGAPSFGRVPQPDPYRRLSLYGLAAVELTGDDRLDLLLVADLYVGIFANASGDVRMTLGQTYPVVSLGDKAELTAMFQAPANSLSWHSEPYPPLRTGLVTFRSGDTILGTVVPAGGGDSPAYATLEISSLPAGSHTITAEYAGDDSYRPATAPDPVTQRVIAEKTTTTITSTSTGGAPVPWSESWGLNAAVTSQLPGDVTGTIALYANGVWLYDNRMSAPASYSSQIWLDPGTYDIYAEYAGNETHPPSRSAPIRQVVTKAPTETHFNQVGEYLVGAGQTPQLSVMVSGFGGVSGKVDIYDGATKLMTVDVGYFQTPFTMPALPIGVHELRAVYEGGTKWLPSESAILRYTVVPQGFALVATVAANAASIAVNATYTSAPAPSAYKVYERIANGAWTLVRSSHLPSFTRQSAQSGKVYAYRMEALDSAGALLGTSNVDIAVVTLFTDDALKAGMPIKAVHIQELLTATNLLRTNGGLAAVSLTDAIRGKPIRKSHLDTLSNAIAEGRAANGASAPPPLPIAAGSVVRATHILQLREALK